MTSEWTCRACGYAEDECECTDDGMPDGDVTGCDDYADAQDPHDIEYDR